MIGSNTMKCASWNMKCTYLTWLSWWMSAIFLRRVIVCNRTINLIYNISKTIIWKQYTCNICTVRWCQWYAICSRLYWRRSAYCILLHLILLQWKLSWNYWHDCHEPTNWLLMCTHGPAQEHRAVWTSSQEFPYQNFASWNVYIVAAHSDCWWTISNQCYFDARMHVYRMK